MLTPQTIFFALSGGVLPALLWLWFWLQEDRLHPEPRSVIIRTFILGMIAVPLILPLEQFIQKQYALVPMLLVFLLVVTEEIFKLAVAYISALESKAYDEPIDAVIYLIPAALGFAAMENTFFLISSITSTGFVPSFVTGNLRFIGATLLHVLSSGSIGLFIGLSFWKGFIAKKVYLIFGIALAILLHTVFNLYIMKSAGTEILIIFCFVWVAILLLIAGLEKVKRLKEL